MPFIRCLLLSLDSPAAFSLLNSIVVDTSLSSYYRLSHLGKEYERNAVSLSDGSKEPPEASEIGKYIASSISHLGPRRPIFSIPHAGGRLSNEWDDRLNNFSSFRESEIGFCIGIPDSMAPYLFLQIPYLLLEVVGLLVSVVHD